MIDILDQESYERALENARKNKIFLPTYEQLANPDLIPESVKQGLAELGLWDIHALNLWRISWHNQAQRQGGQFTEVPNYIEIPKEITGVDARILIMFGKWFPTGAHKVGACYGPLVSRFCTGRLNPDTQKVIWPSTGNYCRGGAFNSRLMGCVPIAVLPEEMSQERFDWLKEVGAEVHATPGCESNVKEVFDKTTELIQTGGDSVVAANQFEDFSNPTWHYFVTGKALKCMFEDAMTDGDRLAGAFFTTGSAGTIAAGDFLKKYHPTMYTVAGEALQCPTILNNGFGGHRIEGIGDKHIPFIHNIRTTDAVAAIDDEDTYRVLRLFNSEEGHNLLRSKGVSEEVISVLPWFGISSIANMLGCIKTAKYFDMDEHDVLVTVATDSGAMYTSRVEEMVSSKGECTAQEAAVLYEVALMHQLTDNYLELDYQSRKRVHHLKYYTWVEQQGKHVDEINAQWFDRDYFTSRFEMYSEYDKMIVLFNHRTGLLDEFGDEYQRQVLAHLVETGEVSL